jgi:hypothetical protein
MSADRSVLVDDALPAHSSSASRSLFLISTFLFLLSTLFDPADLAFGLKLPLYAMCWVTGVIYCVTRKERTTIPLELVLYGLLMIVIPLLSIWNYYIVDGREPYEGFPLLKAYLFISMAVLLYVTGTNLLKYLSLALTLLAVTIVTCSIVLLNVPSLFLPAYLFGDQYKIFSATYRDYGGLVMFQMYFVTSPMLAISAAYYFDRAHSSRGRRRWWYAGLTLLSLAGLVVAGTRNNIAAAILLPLALIFLYARRKGPVAITIGTVSGIAIVLLSKQLGILLNPTEVSNETKLTMFGDYLAGFANPIALVFGKGLGAYQQWTGRGYYYITELTYLEIIRNFGLLLGGLMVLLLLYPMIYAYAIRPSYNEKHIIVGYAMYLVMCASNPLLFSSMGMMILSVITANMALYDARARSRSMLAA